MLSLETQAYWGTDKLLRKQDKPERVNGIVGDGRCKEVRGRSHVMRVFKEKIP